MAISVVMPALEMAQETGKLLAWKKQEGEQVSKGEPLLEIETDKAVVEVEAPGDGILAGISAQVGAEIPVGQTIAWLVKPGEAPPAKSAAAGPGARAVSSAERTVPAAAAGASTEQAVSAPQISPKARRLAKELGVDFTKLHGTGPGGTISSEDVQSAADAKSETASHPTVPEIAPLSKVARLMAERTTQSWTSVPHFFTTREVDCARLLETNARISAANEKAAGVRTTISDVLIALVARTLAKHPQLNASWAGSGIRANADINISLAIAVKDGVVGAVIHKADTLNLGEIAQQRRDLAERARNHHLHPADITGGTFTVSNLGMYGVNAFTAIITPPQACVLAVGAIADRVVAREGKVVIRPMMTLTLSTDHRVADGARAAEFLRDLVNALQDPETALA
jgi:pyruvate dehydrogenase E2 component (dihydrolipoamide acetyltransferase)